MGKKLLFILFIFSAQPLLAQNVTGQWKGEFSDLSAGYSSMGGDKCEYVLELETNGNKVTGSSYTYFSEGGRRYYTICKVEGVIDPKKKYVEVRETARTKTNIPNNVNNCLQIHKLTYFKKGNEETMEGDWIPAPNQAGDCGFGSTVLSRRLLVSSFPQANNKIAKKENDLKQETKKIAKTEKADPSEPIASATDGQNNLPPSNLRKNNTKDSPNDTKDNPVELAAKLKERVSTVIKTIEVETYTVKVDLYDNGDIDGDSISLFYNGRLLLSNKRLSDKAITLTLPIEKENNVNELVMYAENLGSIPPNTALMVVTDGPNRYEVRITSDLKKSGVINFVHKKPQ